MRLTIINFLFLAIFLLFYNKGFSQQYFVKSYTIEDGLPTRNINDACQDENGYMWFATNFGISKYDGSTFTNYDTTNGLPNQLYRKLKKDEKGILWAIPDAKLDTIVYFKDNKWWKIAPPPKEARNYQMNSFDIIYKNSRPVICMGSFDGFYIYENDAWLHFTISDDEKSNYVYTVIASNYKFYMSTMIGVCIFEDGKTDWSLNKLIQSYGTDIIAIHIENGNTPDEKIWLLNEKWLGYINHSKFRMVSNKFQLPHPSIFYFSFLNNDKKGNVFFGNIWAKYFISNTSDIPAPLMFDNGFSSHGATSIFIDHEQNIWITDTRGINKINNLKVINYFKKNGMLEDEVTAIAELNDGRIVLGHNNGLSILNNNTIKTIEFPDLKLNTRRVSDMVKDKEGNLWFVSISRGLGKLHPDGNISWYSSEKYPIINVVHQDESGRIWVGADTKILYLQDGKLVEYVNYKEESNKIRKIFAAKNGGIYVAGSSGLWHILDDKIEKVPSASGNHPDNVFAYYFDESKGVEYVGTLNGLYVIEDGRITKYRKNGIEINHPVFFIFQDNEENFWIGSNDGVYKWNGFKKLDVFNVYNGLAGWETNRAAGMVDSKGRIWIGTDRGLTCLLPGYDKTVIPIPEIKLLYSEDTKGNLEELSKKCSINYANNTLSFHFLGLSFYNEELLEYKYKLEGYDKDWQEANQAMLKNIKYIGLKPGKYTLCVMARNFSGNWSKISRSEVIRITPPVYLTWWFLVLAFLLLSGIIYGIIRYKLQRTHNLTLEKEIVERKRIEQALTESRKKYLDLVELLPETIYEADFDGKIVYMNDTGLRQFGYHYDDLKSGIRINQIVAPESYDDMHQHLTAVKESKKSDRAIMTGMKKDGATFPLSIHTVPIVTNASCTGTRGIIMNLTEQKRYEDQLQKNAADLKALNTSKDKFFSIIAHDLRSPFTSFLGFTEILDEEFETLPKDEIQTILTSMSLSAKNLYQLLENLLEWSLLNREVTKYEPKSMHLLPLVNNCLDVSLDTIKKKKINYKIEIPESVEVIADIHMLQSIIRNLLSNAIKFTHKGGSVQISAYASEDHFVTIEVKDNGIGMDDSLLEKIFRIDTNTNTKGTEGELSTGLGLILCKEFVEKHGGKIWVDSTEGKGSTFYFTVKGISG